MKYRSVLLGVLALSGLWLAACANDNPTAPSRPTEPASGGAEIAVASNSWVIKANMPTHRTDLATATVRNAAGQSVVYAIGGVGWDRNIGTSVANVTAYNVATNNWTSRRPLPKALAHTNGAGVLNGKIYVTGGHPDGGMNWFWPAVYMYDPATNTWTRKRDMPRVNGGGQYPAGGGVTGVIGGKLYVVSGCYLKDPTYGSLSQSCNPLFLRYNQATDRWVILPPPFPLSTHGLVNDPSIGGVIDGKFYVMAGSVDPNDPTGGVKAHFAVYDPATNKWIRRTPLGLKRPGAASTVLGGKLYVMGGLRFNGVGVDILDITIVYDPATDGWTRRAFLPSPRYGISASKVLLNGKPRIELVGGAAPGNNLQYVP